MDSSTELTPVDEIALLKQVNRQKAVLFAPVILYIILAMLLGVVSNPVAITSSWRWPKTTTRCFLLWLACIDTLNCLITMPSEISFLTSYLYFPNSNFCRLSRFFTISYHNASGVVFVVIAIDRYIRICQPRRKPLSIFGAKMACAASLVVGVSLSWPALILYGKRFIKVPSDKVDKGYITGIMCHVVNDMDETLYPLAFYITMFFYFIVCFSIISVLYVLIGRLILRHIRAREEQVNTKSNEQRIWRMEQTVSKNSNPDGGVDGMYISTDPTSGEVRCLNIGLTRKSNTTTSNLTHKKRSGRLISPPKSTLMMSVITAVLVISYLPFFIIIIVNQHIGPSFNTSLSPTIEVVIAGFIRSYLINSCTNPIVYGLFNTQFRIELKNVFRVNKARRNSALPRREGTHCTTP